MFAFFRLIRVGILLIPIIMRLVKIQRQWQATNNNSGK
jgi:hypothetical protein